MSRIAIVGSRSLHAWVDVSNFVQSLPEDDEIVSGGAFGVDTDAASAAVVHHRKLVEFKPDYFKHGQTAPFVRNQEIAEYADRCVAFWDGKSRGTLDTVRRFKKLGKPVEVREVRP